MKRPSHTLACLRAIIMTAALAWSTVSLPFVAAAQSQLRESRILFNPLPEERCEIPVQGGTEEKTENSSNSLSEYLHDHHAGCQNGNDFLRHAKSHASDEYLAWHPELISPPPDA